MSISRTGMPARPSPTLACASMEQQQRQLRSPSQASSKKPTQRHSPCTCDTIYMLTCLLSLLHRLSNVEFSGTSRPAEQRSSHAAIDPLVLWTAAALLLLLFVHVILPATYAAHRRAALVVLVAITFAGDVTWLRSSGGGSWESSSSGGGSRGGSSSSSLSSGIDSKGDVGAVIGNTCSSRAFRDSNTAGGSGVCSSNSTSRSVGATAVHPPLSGRTASWALLADALLIRSGVMVVCMHAVMLSLELPWRIAMQHAEVALIMSHTTLPLARFLSTPAYVPLLIQLHAALKDSLSASLVALAGLPLPVQLVQRAQCDGTCAEAPVPTCLPIATVLTVQLVLGLALPLWIAFVWSSCASGTCACSSLASGSGSTAWHGGGGGAAVGGDAAPAASCRQQGGSSGGSCGRGDGRGGGTCCPLPLFFVQGVPQSLLTVLLGAANSVIFVLLTCAIWGLINMIPIDFLARSGACLAPA